MLALTLICNFIFFLKYQFLNQTKLNLNFYRLRCLYQNCFLKCFQLSAKEKELQLALQKQEKYQESVQLVTDKLDDVQSKLAAPLPNNTEDLQVQMEDYKVFVHVNFAVNIPLKYLSASQGIKSSKKITSNSKSPTFQVLLLHLSWIFFFRFEPTLEIFRKKSQILLHVFV